MEPSDRELAIIQRIEELENDLVVAKQNMIACKNKDSATAFEKLKRIIENSIDELNEQLFKSHIL